MRIIISGAVAVVTLGLLLTACNSNDSSRASRSSTPDNLTTQTPNDGVRRITVTELKNAFDKGAVLIVDVRAPEAYSSEHIKGSINIPEPSTLARTGELPPDKMIVTYCS